jgi:tetratricopeptide (TPR) repeat protein
MRHLLFLLSIIFILWDNIYCQIEENPEEYFKEGEYFFNRGDYEEAVHYYLKLVKSVSDSIYSNFFTYLISNAQYESYFKECPK